MTKLPILLFLSCAPLAAQAAGLPGAELSLAWGLPFVGILLSIALCPLFLPHFWHHHFGKVSAFWALSFLLPAVALYGTGVAGSVVAHALLEEFLPFIILLFALYTVSGGILISGNLHGSPRLNTGLLALGTLCASLMGTTGAAMLLIRPLLRANDNRKHNVHVVVFFIFLVANIGGGLTPIGDPPLFLGFLKGIDFFWTLQHMLLPVAFAAAVLLTLFYAIDSWLYRQEGVRRIDPTPDSPLRVEGKGNFALLAVIVFAVLLSGLWKPGVSVSLLGVDTGLQDLVRDGLMLGCAALSLWMTPKAVRERNEFDWGPILEVAKLFAGIFVAMAPAIAILRAGTEGALAPLVRTVTDGNGAPIDSMYFWLSGALSSFLDNAPTYLVFFNLAHGDPAHMMGPMASTLMAISAGAVFMGANTYIGNAPNFMVKAIAESRGVRMPGFFGYMLWSGAILIPLFVLMTLLFFSL
ncbi:UIT6 family transporter [Microvirgula sp. AG722]|uniref:sodium:proton antiporter n=1 Tax=Microvirgula sp. AG722 TaxID=2183901 RepID=UPI000DC5B0AD|nr:sodium:proton antiporter [Microvirgula sp. AG722]RAS17115.1 UIT6 family transporter [Microvirgula sp. AG722]